MSHILLSVLIHCFTGFYIGQLFAGYFLLNWPRPVLVNQAIIVIICVAASAVAVWIDWQVFVKAKA